MRGNIQERIPLVLTHHPFNTRIKWILLDNFDILSHDPETRDISHLPVVSPRCDRNLRDILVHSDDQCSTEQPRTFACKLP